MSHNFIIANGDTDSIAFKKSDEKLFTEEEQAALLAEINSLMPNQIVWKNDKTYRRFIVFKAKNYVMDDGKTVKIKGSALKGSKKEPALQAFTKEVIDLLLKDKKDRVYSLYLEYVSKILNLKDISPWCFKATVTKKVLDPTTTFNQKVLTAIGNTAVNEGDKVYMFFTADGSLCLREHFKGNADLSVLLGKLRDTMEIFTNVIDVDLFPDLTLKRNKDILDGLSKVVKPTNVIPINMNQLITRTN